MKVNSYIFPSGRRLSEHIGIILSFSSRAWPVSYDTPELILIWQLKVPWSLPLRLKDMLIPGSLTCCANTIRLWGSPYLTYDSSRLDAKFEDCLSHYSFRVPTLDRRMDLTCKLSATSRLSKPSRFINAHEGCTASAHDSTAFKDGHLIEGSWCPRG